MGTGRIGLGQPAADDRHLAGPVSGLVPQQAREFGRQPGTIRVLRGRRLKLSGTLATRRKDATSAHEFCPMARVALAAY
jgi:hypothetical protein